MKPILKRPKVDTETKVGEKQEMYRLMKVARLNMDMPEEKERMGVFSWIVIVIGIWLGIWFGYRVIMAMERGLLG